MPGCTNPVAPVFGMVCAKHKDGSKMKIKEYREALRAERLAFKLVKEPKVGLEKRGKAEIAAVNRGPKDGAGRDCRGGVKPPGGP